MIAEFFVNGKKTTGNIDLKKLFESLVSKKPYASALQVVLDDENLFLDVKSEDYNFDFSRGNMFYEAQAELDFKGKRKITCVSLGEVATADLSEEVEDKCEIGFRITLDMKDSDICFYAGENDFIAALLGKKSLGKLTARVGNFGFGNSVTYPIDADGERFDVEISTDGMSLRMAVDGISAGEEIIIENEGKPVIRLSAREINLKREEIYGVCNNRGGVFLDKCFKSVISLKFAAADIDDYTVVPLVKEVARSFKLVDGENAVVMGEPTRNFAAVKSGNRISLYEKAKTFPLLKRNIECDGEFALCSDGAVIVSGETGVRLYFPDGRDLKLDIPKGDSVVIVSEENYYHFAVKNGRYLIRYKVDKESGECKVISAVMGKSNIGLFRDSVDAIGYRDGDIVAVVTTESYREFDYPFAGAPDDFGFVCDCKNFSAGGKSGNYKVYTSFDLNCDFVGCDGLACADGNLYCLGKTATLLAEGIGSAAVIGDYVIAAEKDCVALYYAAFQGFFVLCDNIASKAYTLIYYSGNPIDKPVKAIVEFSFSEKNDET